MKKSIFLICILVFSCNTSFQKDELDDFCYKFIYSIHAKDSKTLNSLIDKNELVKNINNGAKGELIDYKQIKTTLFLNYNPLKYGSQFKEKMSNFNLDDLKVEILKDEADILELKISWYNIFNEKKKESIIIYLKENKIIFIGVPR